MPQVDKGKGKTAVAGQKVMNKKETQNTRHITATMAWDHGMMETSRLGRSSMKSRWPNHAAGTLTERAQAELPTSMIGGELNLDLLPVGIGRREGGEKEALFRAQLIL